MNETEKKDVIESLKLVQAISLKAAVDGDYKKLMFYVEQLDTRGVPSFPISFPITIYLWSRLWIVVNSSGVQLFNVKHKFLVS